MGFYFKLLITNLIIPAEASIVML